MGDRSNIFFRNGKAGVGVYAHWSGLAMADAAMRVVKSKAFVGRLGDANYATRIAVQAVFEALDVDAKSETGFGLWTPAGGPDDNEYRYVVVDVNDGALFVASDWRKPKPSDRIAQPTAARIRKAMAAPTKKKTKTKTKK